MILILLLILVTIILFFISISRIRASSQTGHGSPWWIVTVLTSALFLFIIGVVFYFVDYYSAKHWIEVVPIVDASSQNKGVVGFSLPSGKYLIEVDAERNINQKDALAIRYSLNIPGEGIKIEKEKNLDFDLVGQHRLDTFDIKKNRSDGTFSVEVLKPSRGKLSVKLVTNRYFDM